MLLATSARVMPEGRAPWEGRSSIVMATCWEQAAEAKINRQTQGQKKKRGNFMLRPRERVLTLARAEPEPENRKSEEGADGIDEGIVWGGLATGDEGLMDYVESGIAGSDEERGEAPGPAPADARASNAAIEQEAKDEVFDEVGRLANVVVDDVKLFVGQAGYEPAQDGLDERRGVLRGEGVGGHDEDNDGPKEGGPPGAQPRGNQHLLEARLHLRELRRGTRIAPGLVRHAWRLRSSSVHCTGTSLKDLTRTARNGCPTVFIPCGSWGLRG